MWSSWEGSWPGYIPQLPQCTGIVLRAIGLDDLQEHRQRRERGPSMKLWGAPHPTLHPIMQIETGPGLDQAFLRHPKGKGW